MTAEEETTVTSSTEVDWVVEVGVLLLTFWAALLFFGEVVRLVEDGFALAEVEAFRFEGFGGILSEGEISEFKH